MTDEEQIRQVFHDFEEGGLVFRDIHKVLRCISNRIIGIGIGEQGFVRSKSDVIKVFESGLREEDPATYSLKFEHLDLLIHDGKFANACGEISIYRTENNVMTQSRLLQTLIFVKEAEGWKICGLHASAPMITEENMQAYPLKIAEKLLRSLREEIGEKAYLAEEQFQRAVLADTIAFYIVNFSKNRFEKCQVNEELCAYAEPGTPYEAFVRTHLPDYVMEPDREDFWSNLCPKSVQNAFSRQEEEVRCEYRMRHPDGSYRWTVTVIRLITDSLTGDHKGIMYVKDIDQQKRLETEMRNRAEQDGMTGFYHKSSFVRKVEELLSQPDQPSGVFLMLDIDNFKVINDTCGHPFGDRVLISAATILKELFSGECVLGRLGGDEFAVYIPEAPSLEVTKGQMTELMERLQQIETPAGAGLRITCSIGISYRQNSNSFGQLYQQADQALYRSKQDGKCRFTIYR